jgi:hypothetical protein
MQPIMAKTSPQLTFSAAACALAMAALAISGPAITDGPATGASPLPVLAGIEAPSLPVLPLLPR